MVNLLKIKRFIAEKRTVNLSILLQTFKKNTQEEIMVLLEFLIHRGYVKECVKTPACATKCFKCHRETFAMYEWIDPINF